MIKKETGINLVEYNLLNENALLLICLGFIWITSGISGMTAYPELSILILFTGLSLFNPILKSVRKTLKLKSGNPLNVLITSITIGAPTGMIAGFFAFYDNVNLFFPAFSVLLAIIFAMNAFLFRLKMYYLIAALLLVGSGYIGYYHADNFAFSGLFTGMTLLAFAGFSKIAGEYSVGKGNIKPL
jgi:hypothetical protein